MKTRLLVSYAKDSFYSRLYEHQSAFRISNHWVIKQIRLPPTPSVFSSNPHNRHSIVQYSKTRPKSETKNYICARLCHFLICETLIFTSYHCPKLRHFLFRTQNRVSYYPKTLTTFALYFIDSIQLYGKSAFLPEKRRKTLS
jgi:hypothetical protein